MRTTLLSLIVLATLLAGPAATLAQPSIPGTRTPPGWAAGFLPFLGEIHGLTANAHISVRSLAGQELFDFKDTTFMVLTNRIRLEMSLSSMKGDLITPEMKAVLLGYGMNYLVSVVEPEEKRMTDLYPALGAFIPTELQPAQIPMLSHQVERSYETIGADSVDDQVCVVRRVTLTDPQGRRRVATVWQATELKGMPLRIRVRERGIELEIQFANVELRTPEAALFKVPEGFIAQPNTTALINNAPGLMERRLQP